MGSCILNGFSSSIIHVIFCSPPPTQDDAAWRCQYSKNVGNACEVIISKIHFRKALEKCEENTNGGAFWSYTNADPKSTGNLKLHLQTEKFPSFSEYSLTQR